MALSTTKTFSLEIESIAKEKRVTHMEAVLWYCKKEGIEPDTVSSLISKSLKEKIEANARDLNFLPRQAQLPIWERYVEKNCFSSIICWIVICLWSRP